VLDLGSLFALGKGLAGQAIATAGTTVTFSVPGTTTTDPDTLEQTTIPGSVASSPAIVATIASSATGAAVPGVEVRAGDWRVVLPPAFPDPAPLDVVKVTVCRDARFTGRTATVIGHARSSAGAVLAVYARPVPL
jgi:hypothetical protein